jgi:hypothetical protein
MVEAEPGLLAGLSSIPPQVLLVDHQIFMIIAKELSHVCDVAVNIPLHLNVSSWQIWGDKKI